MDNDKIFAMGMKVLVVLVVAALVGILGNSLLSRDESGNVSNDSAPQVVVSPGGEGGQGTVSCTDTNGGVEICDNGIDEDCDGDIDELCSCPLYPDCLGDANGDNAVNQDDFDLIVDNWVRRDCGVANQCCDGADLTGDGWVNFQDLSVHSDNRENIC